MRITQNFRKAESLILLFNAFVRQRLEYCSVVWNPMYNCYIDQVERVQRKFTRFLFFKFRIPYSDYNTRLSHYGMKKLADRRIISDEWTLFKIINDKIESNLKTRIKYAERQRAIRRPPLFQIPTLPTNVERNSVLQRLQRTHNDWFVEIDLSSTEFRFRRMIVTAIENLHSNG